MEMKQTFFEDNNNASTAKKRKNPFNLQQKKEEKERRQKKKARLIIRNISYKVTEDLLRKHFEQWGTIEDLNILKRADGKLVGCAFVQYETVNQATKAILKGNNKPFLGRPIFIDWALGKNEYVAHKEPKEEPADKKPKLEIKEEENKNDELESTTLKSEEADGSENDDNGDIDYNEDDIDNDDDDDDDEDVVDDADTDAEEDKKDIKTEIKKEKHVSNDVQEGCTVFLKNVPFDAEDTDLRKVCRKFGPLAYAIINREKISGHSKGTAFIKFKSKESADLCLRSGTEFVLMDQVLDPHPALSREEMKNQMEEKSKQEENKDSRNLYLVREGLIMSGSKAAEGVSAADMAKRHKLEQIKTQVLKNLNRFVSRNRLSIHNLPHSYDNDKLKQLIKSYTGLKPHECRVMRENKITAEHPQGKSKGFGFMSFTTHKDALTALRKLNNNPKIFGPLHRPIVAFSIEDRDVHKIKDTRAKKSKLNNPTFKEKLEKRKEMRKLKSNGKLKTLPKGPQTDNKEKLQKHIKKLEEMRANKSKKNIKQDGVELEDYVGTAAKPGTNIRMRSNKKIQEQSVEHNKRVKADKKKSKKQKIKKIHLAERKSIDRPKQGRKVEKDDIAHLVNKYKNMIGTNNENNTDKFSKPKKPKRTKWYTD